MLMICYIKPTNDAIKKKTNTMNGKHNFEMKDGMAAIQTHLDPKLLLIYIYINIYIYIYIYIYILAFYNKCWGADM